MNQQACIWVRGASGDCHAEFCAEFSSRGEQALLRIGSDYRHAAYLNGVLVGNSQFIERQGFKTVCEYDLSGELRAGSNQLLIKAFHMEKGCFQCLPMQPFVSFAVLEDQKELCVSGADTLCRIDRHYLAGDSVSSQLGVGYHYSFSAEEDAWEPAELLPLPVPTQKKPIRNTGLSDARMCRIVMQGIWQDRGGGSAAERMQRAWLSTLPLYRMADRNPTEAQQFPLTLTAEGGDGIFFVGDLGLECAGYPVLTLECDRDTEAYLGWGEHLSDGRVRTEIHDRRFGLRLLLKKGKNDLREHLHRMGCRYLCLFLRGTHSVKLQRFGLCEELYPLKKPNKDFGDRLLNAIYETGRRTLELCLHEHYEDCPWREQALYGMDSRSQMLFGYGAFEEYDFPRASLLLIARSLRADGLIPICAPSENTLTIPSFSAYWVIAVEENAKADYNEAFVKEALPAVERVMQAYEKQTEQDTVYAFRGEGQWNFHEWSQGLDGYRLPGESTDPVADCLLSALVCRAAQAAAALEERLRNHEQALRYLGYAKALAKGLEHFYDAARGLYASYRYNGVLFGFHEYTQAACLTCGLLPPERCQSLCDALQNGREDMVPITLAGLALKYEGLLTHCDAMGFVLDDLCRRFGGMLLAGATSYWETAAGEADFHGAGSLCHAWSAVPCYVLDRFYRP